MANADNGDAWQCSKKDKVLPSMGLVVGRIYRIEDRLGAGAFGEVFKGRDLNSGRPMAFKVEENKGDDRGHLLWEYKIYRRLNDCMGTVGVPHVYYCGNEGDFVVLVMDLLGPCLEDLYNFCHRRFSVKTVCMLGIQMIERVQYIHACGYLHRDIKPENFVMGLAERSHVVYAIDVGLGKPWRDSKGRHIPYAEGKTLTGTARYVSINMHAGKQQSRRDDLEAVTYLILYFLRGSVPWQGLKTGPNDPKYSRIHAVKSKTTPQELAKGYPNQFADLTAYTRGLQFTEEPDYAYCTQLLHEAMGCTVVDYRYDWTLKALRGESLSVAENERRRPSRHSTAVATGGDSSLMASSYRRDSSGPSLGGASNADFTEAMYDTFGINAYQ